MRAFKLILLIVVAVLVYSLIAKSNSSPNNQDQATAADTKNITIMDLSLEQIVVTIPKSGTVNFVNKDNETHEIVVNNESLGKVDAGKSVSKKFDQTGVYEFHCALHTSMPGQIAVK